MSELGQDRLPGHSERPGELLLLSQWFLQLFILIR